ncbi:MAG TPA: GyrI-like domain-containing protein [Vicinamibacterales bacterium]|nr:GyrI-like domain-containing protein [Vicinamibacterales bacterium]
MSHTVLLRQADSRPLAVVRRRASRRELSTVVPAACGHVWTALKTHSVVGAGRHVALYLDGAINLEVGVEIHESFAGAGDVVRSETPAGPVATVTHIGPYDRLAQAHAAILAWCKEHGHALAGPSWEIYGHMSDPLSPPRTDVFYLLKSR